VAVLVENTYFMTGIQSSLQQLLLHFEKASIEY